MYEYELPDAEASEIPVLKPTADELDAAYEFLSDLLDDVHGIEFHVLSAARSIIHEKALDARYPARHGRHGRK